MKCKIVVVMLLLLVLLPRGVLAQSQLTEFDTEGATKDLTPYQQQMIQQTMEDNQFSIQGLINSIRDTLLGYWLQKKQLFMQVFAFMVVYVLLQYMADHLLANQYRFVIGVAALLSLAKMLCDPVIALVKSFYSACTQAGMFVTTFSGVYASVIAAGGEPLTGAGTLSALLLLNNLVSKVVSALLLPLLLSAVMLSFVSGLEDSLQLHRCIGILSKSVSKALVWMFAIFNMLLGMQSFISRPADSLAIKTAKAALTTAVPVVGTAISDAIATVAANVDLIKGVGGVVGMLGVIFIFLVPLCSIGIYAVIFKAGEMLGALFSLGAAAKVFENLFSLCRLMLAICAFYICIIFSFLLIAGGSL